MKKLLIILFMVFSLSACDEEEEPVSGAGQEATDSITVKEEPKTEDTTAEAKETKEKPEPESQFDEMILAVGDSITTGWGAGVAYPSVVQSLTGMHVVNVSTPGISAEQIASNAANYLNQANPRYVIALMGTNNAANGSGGGVNGAINAAGYLARLCHERGITLVLGTLPVIPRNAGENANSEAISNAIRGIGGVRIAEIRSTVSASDVSDGLHPNTRGQQQIGRLFADQIY